MKSIPSEPEVRDWTMLVDGEWTTSADGETIPIENPATRSVFARVPRGRDADVDRAVAAAQVAFAQWKRVPTRERGRALLRIADALEARSEEIARLLATETGNALRTQARPEVRGSIEMIRYFGGLCGEAKGESNVPVEGTINYTVREPLGVVGAIIPWNSPLIVAANKIAPAICMGNTVVLKTAEDAPLAMLEMARTFQEFLPKGVLNVLTGFGAECGVALVQHPGVGKLTFTGSTNVGKSVMHAAAERVLPVSLELGGKSPNIIFPDADEDWVADATIAAARVTRQSQSCTAGTRVFVHDSIFDSFVSRMAEKLSAMKVGDPLDEQSDIGSLINKKQFDRVCAYISDGLADPAAHLVTGGLPPTQGPLTKGYYTLPTIFASDSNDWRLAREEIFGPVLCAIRWRDESEVIRMANDTHYGLAGFVFSRDVNKALRTAHSIQAGLIQVNHGGAPYPGQSFGGYKQSGLGREFSLEGMLESFTVRKNICVVLRD
ncbi:aldehyde dehydrogenase family protein [Hydrogenophaga sp. BPS33]|uniref:aldehyde dehydrogenase family protein n=1 Tax=Hydrogenophaga sp. BPS33 TaxID=2651974 RepID=UPI00131FB91E|nr:aldehyde dehydrogenase family protein [Hydrogenophaga sp. BPS33]QHE84717.1 aldehyde dehydrogenase family protein [Hydrogenophaga sp. BPS33]